MSIITTASPETGGATVAWVPVTFLFVPPDQVSLRLAEPIALSLHFQTLPSKEMVWERKERKMCGTCLIGSQRGER